MKVFEYWTGEKPSGTEEFVFLQMQGARGWELVQILGDYYYFKRENVKTSISGGTGPG